MSFRGWRKTTLTLPDSRVVDAVCPVILSASRATDIPAFFSTWMINRLRAGYVRWTNPFNADQVQYVLFADARMIVFWTKNPKPLLRYLPQIDATGINYYFQFTINDYENEGLEPNVPPLTERIKVFKRLSSTIGPERVIWRFDPLLLSDSLTIDVLLDRIAHIAGQLKEHTRKLVISFADIECYQKSATISLDNPHITGVYARPHARLRQASQRYEQAVEIEIATCAETVDLEQFGIKHNRCIDDDLMVELFSRDAALMDFLGYEPDLLRVQTDRTSRTKSNGKSAAASSVKTSACITPAIIFARTATQLLTYYFLPPPGSCRLLRWCAERGCKAGALARMVQGMPGTPLSHRPSPGQTTPAVWTGVPPSQKTPSAMTEITATEKSQIKTT